MSKQSPQEAAEAVQNAVTKLNKAIESAAYAGLDIAISTYTVDWKSSNTGNTCPRVTWDKVSAKITKEL